MITELDVLNRISEGLSARSLQFMLTGSFALAYYATPRMTRDLDIVVALAAGDAEALLSTFSSDFYIDADAVRAAIQNERLFNMMHLSSGIKVDLIVRKSSEYRLTEFARRQRVMVSSILTWIVSREDLILSKLLWSLDSGSELQLRDVRQLLAGPIGEAAARVDAMNDTSDALAQLVADHHRDMTPESRLHVAASLYETARMIVDSSLPQDLTWGERRLAIARRFYGDELPEAALIAHACYRPTMLTAR
jgi:hypothetical protein